LQSYDILDTVCDKALDDIAALAARLVGVPIALVTLIDGRQQWFKARFGTELRETPRHQSFCGYAILDVKPLVVGDATADPRFADNPLVAGKPNIRFYAGVPLINPDGFALGTLCVIDVKPRDFSADQIQILTELARSVMTTLELHRAVKDMRALALTDALTGLGNRAALIDKAERAIARLGRHGEIFALLMIDLDKFKDLNDSQGHQAGDQALVEVARTLRAGARREDMVARLGGDEFAVLLAACDPADLQAGGDRVRHAVNAAMRARGWGVTASIGGVTFTAPPADVAEALALVDAATYRAKARGGDVVITGDHPSELMAEAAA
jgi:diguanylate cyclase (GGDEF)-like protein